LLKNRLQVWMVAVALFTWVILKNSSALHSPKWQMIGMSYWYRSAFLDGRFWLKLMIEMWQVTFMDKYFAP